MSTDDERPPPTDVYLATAGSPHVDAVLDPTGHLLRIPDGYRWAGTLWHPDPDTQPPGSLVTASSTQLILQPRRPATFTDVTGEPDPFDATTPHRYFRVITATRLTVLEQLVWHVTWLPRVTITDVTPGLITLTGDWDPQAGVRASLFYGGPGMTDPAVRAALLGPPT